MKKRIAVNLFLAFGIIPFVKLTADYIRIVLFHDYSSFSGTFMEYETINAPILFFQAPIIVLIVILLPYNLIILSLGKRHVLSLPQKTGIMMGVMVLALIMIGSFSNVWFYPYVKNLLYLVWFFFFALIFTYLIHVVADKDDPRMLHKTE